MTDTKRPIRVFLCHSSDDKPAVKELYDRLIKDGIDAWLDKEKMIPGQDWKVEIPKAIKNSDIVIVCLSSQSVTKEGFVQKEIKYALDEADEKNEGAIFIIPARLEHCRVPDRINRFHWVDLFSYGGYEKLLAALQIRAESIGAEIKRESKTAEAYVLVSESQNVLPQNFYEVIPQRLKDLLNAGCKFIDISVEDKYNILHSEIIKDYVVCELKLRETNQSFIFRAFSKINTGVAAEYLVLKLFNKLSGESYEWSLTYNDRSIPPYHTFETSGIKSGDVIYLEGKHKRPFVLPLVAPYQEWLTRDLLKELDFDACHPQHIVDTAKEIGASISHNSTYDDLLDSIVRHINESADETPLLFFANRVWFFESSRMARTKPWNKFTKLICHTYQGDKNFRKIIKNATYLSRDFPIQDLLDCR